MVIAKLPKILDIICRASQTDGSPSSYFLKMSLQKPRGQEANHSKTQPEQEGTASVALLGHFGHGKVLQAVTEP